MQIRFSEMILSPPCAPEPVFHNRSALLGPCRAALKEAFA